MKIKTTKPKPLSQEEIDRIVIEQAEDDSAWEPGIHVQPLPTSLSLPAELATRAAFIARLHRKTSVEEWLMDIIQERLAVEETIYSEVKRDLAVQPGGKTERVHRTASHV